MSLRSSIAMQLRVVRIRRDRGFDGPWKATSRLVAVWRGIKGEIAFRFGTRQDCGCQVWLGRTKAICATHLQEMFDARRAADPS